MTNATEDLIRTTLAEILKISHAHISIYPRSIRIDCVDTTVTLHQLQRISDFMKTERINIVPDIYHDGYSEMTPSWTEDGYIEILRDAG